MDPLHAVAEEHGVFLTQEAKGLGYDDRSIARAVRGKLWQRVRRGAFVPMETWLAADEVGKHRIRARAVWRTHQGRVALSHVTAAIEHGMDIWDVDLHRVHVTRLDGGAGRIERDVVHHEGRILSEVELVERNDLLVTSPVRAALEAATLCSTEAGLVTVDSGLHQGCFAMDDLRSMFEEFHYWPRTQHLQLLVRLADSRAESAGESRARYLFFCQGLPRPTLQFEVFDCWGRLIGRTDFAWPDLGLLGEFDGRSKYGRLLRPGQDPAQVVYEEKLREDALRAATQYAMVRLTWADLSRPREAAGRVRQLMKQIA